MSVSTTDAAGRSNSFFTVNKTGSPIIAGGGCYKDPSPAAFCLGTDTGNSAYLGAKELIKAMGDAGRIEDFNPKGPRMPSRVSSFNCWKGISFPPSIRNGDTSSQPTSRAAC